MKNLNLQFLFESFQPENVPKIMTEKQNIIKQNDMLYLILGCTVQIFSCVVKSIMKKIHMNHTNLNIFLIGTWSGIKPTTTWLIIEHSTI